MCSIKFHFITVILFSYGFSRARYIYALISGVGIFLLGAGVTVYHGVMSLLYPPVLAFLPAVSLLYKKYIYCQLI